MVLGLLKFQENQIWVFGLNLEYMNFEFCLLVNHDAVLDFSLAIVNTYEFLILTNDSVGHFRRYDKEIHVIGNEFYTKDRRVLMSKFLGPKDNIWLFFSDMTVEVFDNKFKRLSSWKSNLKPSLLVRSKSGFYLANPNFEFRFVELDANAKSTETPNCFDFKIPEGFPEMVEKERLQSFFYQEKQRKIVFQCKSGMIGQFQLSKDSESLKHAVLWEKAHSNYFVDFDVCSSKPWVISIGNDKTLTIWNYKKHRVEMSWTYTEELLSVSIHPLGFYFCVGMSDKAVVYTLLANSVKEFQKKIFKEVYLKNVYKVEFSKGGNYLVVCSENPNAVNVFQFYNMHCPSFLALKGHTNRITHFEFSKFNGFLYTCSKDGMLYKWSIKDGSRQELFSRGPPLNGMCILTDEKTEKHVIAASDESGGLITMKNDKKNFRPCEWEMTCILYGTQSDRIFVGLRHCLKQKSGCIRMYVSPDELDKFQDFPVHGLEGVRKMTFSENEAKIISLGFDHSIAIISLRDNKDTKQLNDKILVTKRYIENLRSEVAYLTTSLDDDKGLNNNIITLSNLEDQIKELKEKNADRERLNTEEIKRKKAQKDETLRSHNERVKLLKEKKESEINELSNFHAKKITNRNKELGKANCRRVEAEGGDAKIRQRKAEAVLHRAVEAGDRPDPAEVLDLLRAEGEGEDGDGEEHVPAGRGQQGQAGDHSRGDRRREAAHPADVRNEARHAQRGQHKNQEPDSKLQEKKGEAEESTRSDSRSDQRKAKDADSDESKIQGPRDHDSRAKGHFGGEESQNRGQGAHDQRAQEGDPGAGEVQVRAGLQDPGPEQGHLPQGERAEGAQVRDFEGGAQVD